MIAQPRHRALERPCMSGVQHAPLLQHPRIERGPIHGSRVLGEPQSVLNYHPGNQRVMPYTTSNRLRVWGKTVSGGSRFLRTLILNQSQVVCSTKILVVQHASAEQTVLRQLEMQDTICSHGRHRRGFG